MWLPHMSLRQTLPLACCMLLGRTVEDRISALQGCGAFGAYRATVIQPLAGVYCKMTCVARPVFFAARGPLPATPAEAIEREKNIRASNRTCMSNTNEPYRHVIAQGARGLIGREPASLRNDPDLKALVEARRESAVDAANLIYQSKHCEMQSKDYECPRISMPERWEGGRPETANTLHGPSWVQWPRRSRWRSRFRPDRSGCASSLRLVHRRPRHPFLPYGIHP